MKVKRIVPNVGTKKLSATKRFYEGVLGLETLMDMDWIVTYGSRTKMTVRDPLGNLVNILSH